MAWGKVDLCGLDTSKLPVLTPQRMQELYPLVHSGDKAARDEFIQESAAGAVRHPALFRARRKR